MTKISELVFKIFAYLPQGEEEAPAHHFSSFKACFLLFQTSTGPLNTIRYKLPFLETFHRIRLLLSPSLGERVTQTLLQWSKNYETAHTSSLGIQGNGEKASENFEQVFDPIYILTQLWTII